jgi:amidohydrolase
MHVSYLMGASTLLQSARDTWKGTLLCVFQPNEERSGGAQAMIDDGLYEKGYAPVPDVVLGQHVVNNRAGYISTRSGHSLTGKVVLKVRIYGRGGYGSTPQDCIDPIVIASFIVVRLQTIISREIDPNKMALITCGSIHADDAPNIIRDEAVLQIDIRAYNPEILTRTIAAVKRIVAAECQASAVTRTADITQTEYVPPLTNSPEIVGPIMENFKAFCKEATEEMKPDTASDDFSVLAPKGVPYAYLNFGSTDHKVWEDANKKRELNKLPGNHSAYYAPLIEPTLQAGVDALAIVALTFLRE